MLRYNFASACSTADALPSGWYEAQQIYYSYWKYNFQYFLNDPVESIEGLSSVLYAFVPFLADLTVTGMSPEL